MASLPSLSRRGLLGGIVGGLGGAALLSACGDTRPAKTGPPVRAGDGLREITYGTEHPDQYGVLGLPSGTPTALAVLVHGGYWYSEFGAGLMDEMAEDLRGRGFATWNIEYRRIGSGGGFPATFTDVAAAFDKTLELGLPEGLPQFSLGHSAGGHLAVWAASRTSATPGGAPRSTPSTTIALSGVLDLTTAAQVGLGNGAAEDLMGAKPSSAEADYALADPTELVPAKGRVIAVHAEDDQIVPLDQSSTYVQLAQAARGTAELVTVPGGHFDLIETSSDAWKKIVTLLPAS